MFYTRIIGTGSYLPEKVLTNFDLEKFVDTTDEWIVQRTGIRQRHLAEPGTGSSDMGAEAAKRALQSAGIPASELDLIICCTTTADYQFPSTACLLQGHIGAENAAAFDVGAACSGFIYGLSTADAYLRTGAYKTVLLVGADLLSNRLNWEKRETAVLFGDGAGAVILRREEGTSGLVTTYLRADGQFSKLLVLPGGGSRRPITPEVLTSGELDIVMDGKELFKKAIVAFCDACTRALEQAGMTIDDLDLFIPHQANTRIIFAATDRLGLPREKVFTNIEHVANTTAASIPIALDEALAAGRIKSGDKILLAAFGAGLTWGAAIINW